MYLVDPHVRIQSPKKLLVVSWSPQIYKYRTLSIGSTNCFVVVEVVLWKKSPTWKPRWSWLPSTLPHQNQLSSCLQKNATFLSVFKILKNPCKTTLSHWEALPEIPLLRVRWGVSSEIQGLKRHRVGMCTLWPVSCLKERHMWTYNTKLAKFYWTGYIEQYSIWCWCKQTLA